MPSTLLLSFGIVLMIAVLVSERADRTVLSTSVIFLIAGLLLGRAGLGWLGLGVHSDLLFEFVEVALFSILFVDGAELPLRDLRQAWKLPGRALLLGMPLTLAGIAVAGHLLLKTTWLESLLLGAILTPTDPVFVNAILAQEAVPLRVRRLLGVESGLNDGLALPAVLVLLELVSDKQPHLGGELIEVGLGLAIGILVPMVFLVLERASFLAASPSYRPLGGVALAAVLFGLSRTLGANELLAAYSGGITLATLRPDFASATRDFGVVLTEALKLATLLAFGALLSVSELLATGLPGVAFALTVLFAARPAALFMALLGGGLSRKEWIAVAWFGPKGFSSLLYALLLLHAGFDRGTWLFHAAALVIVLSIISHSSSDVAMARVFCDAKDDRLHPARVR